MYEEVARDRLYHCGDLQQGREMWYCMRRKDACRKTNVSVTQGKARNGKSKYSHEPGKEDLWDECHLRILPMGPRRSEEDSCVLLMFESPSS
jgi:hypothetical protein